MMVVITAKIYAGKISHQKTRDQDIFSSCVVLIIILWFKYVIFFVLVNYLSDIKKRRGL